MENLPKLVGLTGLEIVKWFWVTDMACSDWNNA